MGMNTGKSAVLKLVTYLQPRPITLRVRPSAGVAPHAHHFQLPPHLASTRLVPRLNQHLLRCQSHHQFFHHGLVATRLSSNHVVQWVNIKLRMHPHKQIYSFLHHTSGAKLILTWHLDHH